MRAGKDERRAALPLDAPRGGVVNRPGVMTMKNILSALLLAAVFASPPRLVAADWPGLKPDGSTLLPSMWSLKPVGRQIPLGDFPVNIALHPDGKFAAVLH